MAHDVSPVAMFFCISGHHSSPMWLLAQLSVTPKNMFYDVKNIWSKPFVNLLSENLLRKEIELFVSKNSPKLREYHTLLSPVEEHILVTKYVQLNLTSIVRKKHVQICLCFLPIIIESNQYARDTIAADLMFCKQPKCSNLNVNRS